MLQKIFISQQLLLTDLGTGSSDDLFFWKEKLNQKKGKGNLAEHLAFNGNFFEKFHKERRPGGRGFKSRPVHLRGI